MEVMESRPARGGMLGLWTLGDDMLNGVSRRLRGGETDGSRDFRGFGVGECFWKEAFD